MEYLAYITFSVVLAIMIIVLWIWVLHTVARTTAILDQATREIELIALEVRLVAHDFIEVTDELERARIAERYRTRNRRCTDNLDI